MYSVLAIIKCIHLRAKKGATMHWRAEKSDYKLRDPGALGALLVYDWRLRGLLTDAELLEAVDASLSTSVLRHLQRLSLVRAHHGVRPQGGRMRIWAVEDALRVQAAVDLRRATDAKLAVCASAIVEHGPLLDPIFAGWEDHIGARADTRLEAVLEGDASGLLTQPAALRRAVAVSVSSFVARNQFDAVSAPAFLL